MGRNQFGGAVTSKVGGRDAACQAGVGDPDLDDVGIERTG